VVCEPGHRVKSSTQQTLRRLADYESRNVTYLGPKGDWPIVWETARGVYVHDADGRRYLDLTAAFGVANAGHANPRVVAAMRQQAGRLLHAMGDVHPHALKADLCRELSRLTFERWRPHARAKTILCNAGFEAVEAALKTAMLTTGRSCIIAFEGAYHGLGYGTLNATHRGHFRSPFRRQLAEFAEFAPFPQSRHDLAACERRVRALLRTRRFGAVLVEPMQARGGIRIPPPGFLRMLRRLCYAHGALLIADEIYTGLGRTGKWFACEHDGVVPDLICLGKALTGGFPLSACVGRAGVMDAAWPRSEGEAIHTSTFLGHPVGCAMALAQIAELRRLKLPQRAARLGQSLARLLSKFKVQGSRFKVSVRGVGLMWGVELTRPDGSPATAESIAIVKALLHRGFIVLPEGEHGNVISFTPPLTITAAQLTRTARELGKLLRAT
jgi:4-aminobutyrate aminotransferase-like enzyme